MIPPTLTYLYLHPIDDFLCADVALPHPLQALWDPLQTALPELDGERLDDSAVQQELGNLLQKLDVVLGVLHREGDHDALPPDELAPEGGVQNAR